MYLPHQGHCQVFLLRPRCQIDNQQTTFSSGGGSGKENQYAALPPKREKLANDHATQHDSPLTHSVHIRLNLLRCL